MDVSGWSDEAVAGAATPAGAARAAASMGLSPDRVAGIMSAAQAEVARRPRRVRKFVSSRKARGGGRDGSPGVLREFLTDPLTLMSLGIVLGAIRALARGPRRPAALTPVPRAATPPRPPLPEWLVEPEFPSAAAYADRADYVQAVGDWMADPAVRARTRDEGIHSHGAEAWEEIGGALGVADERRARSISVRTAAVSAYSRWQVGVLGGYLAPGACYDLDRGIIALCNMSSPAHLAGHLQALLAARGSDARRLRLAAMGAEGREILALWPRAGELERGAPRGRWTLPPPSEKVVEPGGRWGGRRNCRRAA